MNNPRPLVSVIVPAYNAERFIEFTLRSVIAQTYVNWEAIVADDGSLDKTAEIVKKIAAQDNRVKYVYQKNAGQSAARNLALQSARGELVAFLDADDIFLPTKLERQVNYLLNNPDYGLCYSKIYHFFDENLDKLYYFDLPHPSGHLFPALLRSNFINPLSVMVRKNILNKHGAFEPSFRRVDEQYLWLKLSYQGILFGYLDEALAYYRIHRKSLSNEAVYFKETEERFLDLLEKIQALMKPTEAIQYNFPELIRRTRYRLWVGKLMAGRNFFARFLLFLYNARRNKRLRKIN